MGYIQDFEVHIRVMLEGKIPEALLEEVLKVTKETVLESYRNGIEHGRLNRETKSPAYKGKPTHRNTR